MIQSNKYIYFIVDWLLLGSHQTISSRCFLTDPIAVGRRTHATNTNEHVNKYV